MTNHPQDEHAPRIAVAIPCYNEAPAIGTVIEQFRVALPGAEVVVLDNNSTDGTGDVAGGLGARVVHVPAQGKGHAVREAFALLGDRDVVVLVDGDGTYPAEAAPLLVAPVLEGMADMVVGARQPERGAGAMSPVRGLGNLLIRSAFRVLIGPGTGDLLSGYRAFGPRFLRAVDLRSEGFEIETELAIAAVTHRLRALEVSVPYRPRIAGTVSKLNAFRDGRRILRTILVQSVRRNPMRAIAVSWVFLIIAPLPFRGASWIVDVRLILSMISGVGFIAWAAMLQRRPSRSPRPAEFEKR